MHPLSVSTRTNQLIPTPARSGRPTDSADSPLREAYTDFLLSKRVRRLSPRTLEFYEARARPFVDWLEARSAARPEDIRAADVRAWQAEIAESGKSEMTQHAYARGARCFLRFLEAEGYCAKAVKVDMPKLAEKLLPALSAEDVRRLLDAAITVRDRAIVMVLVDSGVRLGELCALRWGDLDLISGLAIVLAGKGKKDRRVVLGPGTLRALLKYRRAVPHGDDAPLFQSYPGRALTASGTHMVLRRLRERTGIRFSAHTLRRTMASLAHRNGMDVLVLKELLGHKSLDMTMRYIRIDAADLLAAHAKHSPMDHVLTR